MTKEDFTEDELNLLRVIFKGADDLISVKRAPQSWCYVSDGELDKIWL